MINLRDVINLEKVRGTAQKETDDSEEWNCRKGKKFDSTKSYARDLMDS